MNIKEQFNAGIWCAIQEMYANYIGHDAVLTVLKSVRLSRSELVFCINDSSYKQEELLPIANEYLESRKLTPLKKRDKENCIIIY
jgi:hypothetical protein